MTHYARIALAVLFLCAGGSASYADVSQGQHRVALNLGVGIPTSANDFSDTAKTGFAGGVTYLYQWKEMFAIGGQFNLLDFPGEDRTIVQNTGGRLTAESDSQFLQVELVGRLNCRRDKALSPYLQAGIGVNRFSQTTDATPLAGQVFADTGTRETREIADDSSAGLSLSIGGGVESVLRDRFLVGLSAYWNTFLVDDDDFGSSAINVPTLFAQLGLLFG